MYLMFWAICAQLDLIKVLHRLFVFSKNSIIEAATKFVDGEVMAIKVLKHVFSRATVTPNQILNRTFDVSDTAIESRFLSVTCGCFCI